MHVSVLWQAQLFRMLIVLLVLCKTKLPFATKVLIAILVDLLDFRWVCWNIDDAQRDHCDKIYTQADKTGDMLTNFALFLTMFQQPELTAWYPLLIFLFFFRLIGMFVYAYTQNRASFILFPDLFTAVLLFLSLTIDHLTPQQLKYGLGLVGLAKVGQEVSLHANKVG